MFATVAILLLALYIYLGRKEPAIALVTSPFIAGTLFVLVAAEEDYAAMVVAPFICLATLITVATSRRDPDSDHWSQTYSKWILVTLMALTLFVVACGAFAPLGVTGIVFMALLLGSLIAYRLTSQHATAAYVISTIGASMRQNLPLPMALESAASGFADDRSRILLRIQKWLVQGYSLSEAIKRGYPKCPGHAVAMIAAGERIDQLPFAIKAIEADMVTRADDSRKIRPIHPLYPVILMVFMFFMLFGIMLFVMPQFKTVLSEMVAGPLPPTTRLLIGIFHFVALDYGWLLGLASALIVLVAAPLSIYARFRPRRPKEPYLLSRIADFVKWHLPILHRFEKNYSLIQVVELLRLSLNAGCTVNDAIDNTIGLDVNNCFKKRLRRCLEKVERGDSIAAAIRESKLGSPLAWAFDEKVNQGNTLSILETLESFYRSNYSYCVNLARFIIWPCVMLVLGATVGFVVYAIFSPGIMVINNLTELVTP
ncbi:MAG: type II secretion system F family protein [Phycisphaerae bacterium]|nr:type II secretion system F family protein [Phycisphaerae bacterium]